MYSVTVCTTQILTYVLPYILKYIHVFATRVFANMYVVALHMFPLSHYDLFQVGNKDMTRVLLYNIC